MSGRSSSAVEEVAGTSYSASGSDDAQASQLPDRQRRRLPIVDTHNLGRVLRQAEIQVGASPSFFFAEMPTPHTPKSAEKARLNSRPLHRRERRGLKLQKRPRKRPQPEQRASPSHQIRQESRTPTFRKVRGYTLRGMATPDQIGNQVHREWLVRVAREKVHIWTKINPQRRMPRRASARQRVQ
jgi:hypothetical protein